MDATELLTKQHRIVEQLFSQLKDASGDSREDIVTNLARNLVAHMKIEEEIFYPAAQEIDPDQVKESYSEHAEAMPLLDKLMEENLSDEQFMQIAEELEEKITHHVKEEESELFPQCRSHMDTEQLTELGDEMQSLFEDIFTGAVSINEMDSDIASSENDEEAMDQERMAKQRKGRKTA